MSDACCFFLVQFSSRAHTPSDSFEYESSKRVIQANLDMSDSLGPGELVRHMQNPSYTYDTYLICKGLGPSISSVIDKSPSYSGLLCPSSPVLKNILRRIKEGRLCELYGGYKTVNQIPLPLSLALIPKDTTVFSQIFSKY